MVLAFLYGLIQGALLGLLFNTLMPGLIGSMVFAVNFFFQGSTAFSGILVLAIANVAFYFLFSAKKANESPALFVTGLAVGAVLLMLSG